MTLFKYISRKVISYVVTAFGAITVNFVIPRLIPGNPIRLFTTNLSRQSSSVAGGSELVEEYLTQFGLKGDLWTQYIGYLKALMKGDLGLSIMAFPMHVQELISRALPWTIGLLFTAAIVSWILGILLGTFISTKRESKVIGTITYICLGLSQVPYYILAMVFILLFAYLIPLFPASGLYSITVTPGFNLWFFLDVIKHSVLPALSLIIVSLGWWIMEIRSIAVSILGEDYLILAEAKGLKRYTILTRYLLRNALLPGVTSLAMWLGSLMGGALLTEIVFSYPGMGLLYMNALQRLDYNTMQGVFLVVTFSVLTAAYAIELLYPLIDPRVGRK